MNNNLQAAHYAITACNTHEKQGWIKCTVGPALGGDTLTLYGMVRFG